MLAVAKEEDQEEELYAAAAAAAVAAGLGGEEDDDRLRKKLKVDRKNRDDEDEDESAEVELEPAELGRLSLVFSDRGLVLRLPPRLPLLSLVERRKSKWSSLRGSRRFRVGKDRRKREKKKELR